MYQGTAPIFATTKLADMARLEKLSEIDRATGLPQDADASMIYRRLKVYKFNTRIAKPVSKIAYCPACFFAARFEPVRVPVLDCVGGARLRVCARSGRLLSNQSVVVSSCFLLWHRNTAGNNCTICESRVHRGLGRV